MVGTSYFSHFDGPSKAAKVQPGPRWVLALGFGSCGISMPFGSVRTSSGQHWARNLSNMEHSASVLALVCFLMARCYTGISCIQPVLGGTNSGPHMGSFISENGFI